MWLFESLDGSARSLPGNSRTFLGPGHVWYRIEKHFFWMSSPWGGVGHPGSFPVWTREKNEKSRFRKWGAFGANHAPRAGSRINGEACIIFFSYNCPKGLLCRGLPIFHVRHVYGSVFFSWFSIPKHFPESPENEGFLCVLPFLARRRRKILMIFALQVNFCTQFEVLWTSFSFDFYRFHRFYT